MTRSDGGPHARLSVIIGMAVWLAVPAVGWAQQPEPIQGFGTDLTPAEVQRLFDAYEMMQAQEMLDLTDDQFPQFVGKLKALQEARRQTQQGRQRLLRQLQQLANQPSSDEAVLEERLDDLRRHDREAADARRLAYEEIDAMLNVRQQVRFRMFEQAMERRRLDLLMRARRQQQQRRNPGR